MVKEGTWEMIPKRRIQEELWEYNLVVSHEVVQHNATEVSLWVVSEEQEGRGLDLIILDKKDDKWHSKTVHEEEGLFDLSCPVRLLDITPEDRCYSFDEDWRRKVRNQNGG